MPAVTSFLSSIGVNTHVDATASPYGNVTLVIQDLAYLGVSNIRDHAYDTDLAAYKALAANGVHLDLIVDGDAKASVDAMIPLANDITSFEGANEVDVTQVVGVGTNNPALAATTEQQILYNLVKSTASISAIPVLNDSVATAADYARYAAPSSTDSDINNIHAYAAYGDIPQLAIPKDLASESNPAKPSVITETGYFTMLNNTIDPSGVDENVQARYTLDSLLDGYAGGATQTYLYELLDEGADPNNQNAELHYGLFNADGTPKLAATALHDLTSILSATATFTDDAEAAAPTLNPTYAGLPATGRSLELTAADGSIFLAVWAEPTEWDTDTQSEITPTTSTVTVNLGATAAAVSVYDPLIGTSPIATYANISSVTLHLSDDPLIIRVAGPAAAAQTVASTPVVTTVTPAQTDASTPAATTVAPAQTDASTQAVTTPTPDQTDASTSAVTTAAPDQTDASTQAVTTATIDQTDASTPAAPTAIPASTDDPTPAVTTETPDQTDASTQAVTTPTPDQTDASTQAVTTPTPDQTDTSTQAVTTPAPGQTDATTTAAPASTDDATPAVTTVAPAQTDASTQAVTTATPAQTDASTQAVSTTIPDQTDASTSALNTPTPDQADASASALTTVTSAPTTVTPAPTTPTPAPTVVGTVSTTDLRTGHAATVDGTAYAGPSGATYYYAWTRHDSVSLAALSPNAFLKGGSGNDTLQSLSGSNVLDGGGGSNLLIGATANLGTDQFVVDPSTSKATSNTIVNFHQGDTVTIWGFEPGAGTSHWNPSQQSDGYKGATLHATLTGAQSATTTLTLAGFSIQQVRSQITTSTGTDNGQTYLRLTDHG